MTCFETFRCGTQMSVPSQDQSRQRAHRKQDLNSHRGVKCISLPAVQTQLPLWNRQNRQQKRPQGREEENKRAFWIHTHTFIPARWGFAPQDHFPLQISLNMQRLGVSADVVCWRCNLHICMSNAKLLKIVLSASKNICSGENKGEGSIRLKSLIFSSF